jgi:hypothetical protein
MKPLISLLLFRGNQSVLKKFAAKKKNIFGANELAFEIRVARFYLPKGGKYTVCPQNIPSSHKIVYTAL